MVINLSASCERPPFVILRSLFPSRFSNLPFFSCTMSIFLCLLFESHWNGRVHSVLKSFNGNRITGIKAETTLCTPFTEYFVKNNLCRYKTQHRFSYKLCQRSTVKNKAKMSHQYKSRNVSLKSFQKNMKYFGLDIFVALIKYSMVLINISYIKLHFCENFTSCSVMKRKAYYYNKE